MEAILRTYQSFFLLRTGLYNSQLKCKKNVKILRCKLAFARKKSELLDKKSQLRKWASIFIPFLFYY